MKQNLLMLIGPIFVVAAAALAVGNTELGTVDTALRAELVEIRTESQEAQQAWVDSGELNLTFERDMVDIDRRNIEYLKKIIEERGWPTKTLVGEKAAAAAFLIVQRSNFDIVFQEQSLILMKEIAKKHPEEVSLPGIALLTDRVRMAKGEKQLFGTQVLIISINRDLMLYPVEDFAGLDERRAAYGLLPLEKRMEQLREIYGIQVPKE